MGISRTNASPSPNDPGGQPQAPCFTIWGTPCPESKWCTLLFGVGMVAALVKEMFARPQPRSGLTIWPASAPEASW